jgi:hypothetical protein
VEVSPFTMHYKFTKLSKHCQQLPYKTVNRIVTYAAIQGAGINLEGKNEKIILLQILVWSYFMLYLCYLCENK